MTLYTVAMMEMVWAGALSEGAPLRELRVGGVLMQAEPLEEGKFRVVRLLDGPLGMYLDPRFAPGSIVERGDM